MKTFWSVFFPLAMPGMATGALIVFILCLGFYITPAVLGGGKVIMVSSRIANDIEIFFNWGAASALGVVLLVMTALLIWIFMKLLKIYIWIVLLIGWAKHVYLFRVLIRRNINGIPIANLFLPFIRKSDMHPVHHGIFI